MKIVFVSNYYNHHQKPFSEALYNLTEGGFRFVQTRPMSEERKAMGWGEDLPEFVLSSYGSEEDFRKCESLIEEADVVIAGGCELEKIIRKRVRRKKLVLRYAERRYKHRSLLWQLPLWFLKYSIDNFPNRKVYYLCASAYASMDFAITGMRRFECYKFGYFPEVKHYDDFPSLAGKKKEASILWVARLIELKHPDAAILVAERLHKEGYDFHIDIIGSGPLEGELKRMIRERGLEGCVSLLGSMKPEEVRTHMEESSIFLFTSDFNEGWGAVLNESMNSACAVVASHAIGSVPYLIDDGVNGLIYKNGDIDDLYAKTKWLLDNPEKAKEMGKNAYATLCETWNADVAARRVIKMSEALLRGEKVDGMFPDGPCSKANRLKNNWKK